MTDLSYYGFFIEAKNRFQIRKLAGTIEAFREMAMTTFRTSVSTNPSKSEDPENEFVDSSVLREAGMDIVKVITKVSFVIDPYFVGPYSTEVAFLFPTQQP